MDDEGKMRQLDSTSVVGSAEPKDSSSPSLSLPFSGPAEKFKGFSLDDDQTQRLNGLRRSLWQGGIIGGCTGFLAGLGAIGLIHRVPALKKYRVKNTYTLVALLSPVVGVYLGSTVVGRNEVQLHGDIFERNAKPESTYMQNEFANRMIMREDSAGSFERRKAHLEERRRKAEKERERI